jgi:hypothetical protein
MPNRAKFSTEEALRRLKELHLHRHGPKHALRAVARLVIANDLRGEMLTEAFEHDAAGLQMHDDLVIQQVLSHLRSEPGQEAPKGIRVVLPDVANDNGDKLVSLATCSRD